MQRVLGHHILILEEDLTSDKARKIHLDAELTSRVSHLFRMQQQTSQLHKDNQFMGNIPQVERSRNNNKVNFRKRK